MQPKCYIPLSLGERIRQARKARKLTQGDLAQKIGLSAVTLNRYETGRRTPPADVVVRLTQELNCDSNWIMTGEPKDASANESVADIDAKRLHEDSAMRKIIELLEYDLPEAKEQILKILEGRKLMKDGFNALSVNGN